jgi:hypothetical protein
LDQLLENGVDLLLLDVIQLFHVSDLVILAGNRLVFTLNIFADNFELFVHLLHVSFIIKTLINCILKLTLDVLVLALDVHALLLGIQKQLIIVLRRLCHVLKVLLQALDDALGLFERG